MARLDRELGEGKTAAALVTAMTGAQLGAAWFNALPRWLLEFMTKFMMTYGEKEGQGNYQSFRQLAPTLRHDGQILLEMSGRKQDVAAIGAETLLLGGGRSSAFLKTELARLAEILPNARRVGIEKLEHGSAQNADMRGNPLPIAEQLVLFFGEQVAEPKRSVARCRSGKAGASPAGRAIQPAPAPPFPASVVYALRSPES